MKSCEDLLYELSDLCGIIPEYWDVFGNRHTACQHTKKSILRAMNLDIDSAEAIENEINIRTTGNWKSLTDPVIVRSVNDRPVLIPVYIPVKDGEESGLTLRLELEDEKGQKDLSVIPVEGAVVSDQKWIDGIKYVKIELPLPDNKEIGYYSANITCSGKNLDINGSSRIIITPDACYMPADLENGKTWGLVVNLYSIRSGLNWGVGDFGDLKRIIDWASGLNGGFVGINPLHATANKRPCDISPYSPISRLYKNFIYLNMEDVPEIKELGDKVKTQPEKISELNNALLLDYEKAAAIKNSVLIQAFEHFYDRHYMMNSDRAKDFASYISKEGRCLDLFAAYMALSMEFAAPGAEPDVSRWQDWPEDYKNPMSPAVDNYVKKNEKEILFYKYIQWLIDVQMEDISKNARMPVGIYHDLAIGSVSGGSDIWSAQDEIALGIDVGAPPDDFNPNGQNWGFPPFIPERLKQTGYDFLIRTIRKNMNYCGAIRIDHALGMFRLFWIPEGMSASEGAYVRYPTEDILRIIALESVRNRTIVIAEDLGTLAENVRETLFRFRMLSYRLLYFERNYPDPSFTPPDKYPETAICSVTTHDLPTINGWWTGRDIDTKKDLGISNDDASEKDMRQRDKSLLINALQSQGIIATEFDFNLAEVMPSELRLSIYEYLARTPCKLMAVSLDDAIGALDQQNMPGIANTYPSWRQRSVKSLEEFISDNWFYELKEMCKKHNR